MDKRAFENYYHPRISPARNAACCRAGKNFPHVQIHQPATPKKDPNTAHIASWDDGNDETELPAVEERPKVRPIQREKQVDKSPADWKSWDDL